MTCSVIPGCVSYEHIRGCNYGNHVLYRLCPGPYRVLAGWIIMSADEYWEIFKHSYKRKERITELEKQLKTCRNDTLERAAKIADKRLWAYEVVIAIRKEIK